MSAKGGNPAPSTLPGLPSSVKLPSLPKLPKELAPAAAQVEKQATSLVDGKPASAAAPATNTGAPAAAASAPAATTNAEAAAPPETLWSKVAPIAGWAAPATLVPLAIGVGIWWWKKRKSTPAGAEAAKKNKPALDMFADWKSFRRKLPRSMRRALDDLQPVIVLGNNASEKEMLSLQLSRVADNEQLFPGRVSYRGKGLDLYLGARSLVLVPSDEFLDAPASNEDESWRKVLLEVARVRAPRVVVCLAQAPLDSGNLDEMTLWTSKLRSHVDVIVAVRNEDIELSVALVQAPTASRSATPRSTDALFELLGSLGKHEGFEETLSLRLDAVSDQLSPRVEERRESAQRWVIERLRRTRKGWPRLLAHPEYDSTRVLMLARFFEEFESWSASLGAGLAELLVRDERQTRRVLGQELCFVPCVDRRLIGTLAAFAGPSETRAGRWRPKQSLVHRLVVATVVGMLSVGLWLAYEHDETAWDEAATAALRYDPPAGANELDVVRRYVDPGSRIGAPRAKFFERETVRCVAVDSARRYLSGLLDHAVEAFEAPEDVLQLVALYVAGNADACKLDNDPNQPVYAELSATIQEHIEQWRHVTGLSEEEIAGYLELACPQTRVRLSKLEAEYGQVRSGEQEWDDVPSVATFGADLTSLRGQCQLTAEERASIEDAEAIVGALNGIGERHGAALSVLETIRKLDTPTMGLLTGVFDRYERRLQAIEDLGDEHEGVQQLARDLRPFSDLDGARSAAPEVGSLGELNQQLRAHLAGEVPEGEDAMVRLTVAANTYVIDRQKVRASLLVRALGHLQQDFIDTTIKRELAASSQELVFFPDSQHDRRHHWATPGSIPSGVGVLEEVPWRYTATGFRDAVLGPVESMHELFGAHRCGDGKEDPERDAHVARANEFVATRLANYLRGYAEAWRRVYDSFTISANGDAELAATLAALSRPTSIQVALLREVLRQTRLSAADGWPFLDMLGIASAPFDTLEGVVNDKALGDYQGLLLELANAGQDVTEASATGWAAASAPAPRPSNADDNVNAFVSSLSGFGRIVVSGLRDPKVDVRTRAQA
ncbi:MAG TPA: ImcF-related family protein, partial [Polyangiaceae bacterium]|nr:ImcF-related family protein [Polyangiaceae bacterium]